MELHPLNKYTNTGAVEYAEGYTVQLYNTIIFDYDLWPGSTLLFGWLHLSTERHNTRTTTKRMNEACDYYDIPVHVNIIKGVPHATCTHTGICYKFTNDKIQLKITKEGAVLC